MLGRAQDGGVPHFGCNKPCCTNARENGHLEFPASLGIHDTETDALLLIEATPAIEPQLAMLQKLSGVQRKQPIVDGILITHAHTGHYVGLAQLGKEVASTKSIPTYVSKQMASFLNANAPWSQLLQDKNVKLCTFNHSSTFSPVDGLQVTPVEVPHRRDWTDTVAFKITGPNQTVLFVPDIDSWKGNEELIECLLQDVDVAYIDATFYDGNELPNVNLETIPHPFMVDSMETLQTIAKEKSIEIRFIHLNHTNPALWDTDIQNQIEERGFHIAKQGEMITL